MAVSGVLGAVCEGCVAVCVCGDFISDSGVLAAVLVASVVVVSVVCESVASVCGVAKVTALVFFDAVEVVFFFRFLVVEEAVAVEAVAVEAVAVVEVVVFARVFAESLCDVPPGFCDLAFMALDEADVGLVEGPADALGPAAAPWDGPVDASSGPVEGLVDLRETVAF